MTEKEGEKRGDRRDKEVEREAESELRKRNYYKEGKRRRETERKRKEERSLVASGHATSKYDTMPIEYLSSFIGV